MIITFLKYGAVLVATLILGRWFDIERNKLLAKGQPWYKAWLTVPGLLIITILCILIAGLLIAGK